MTAGEVGQPLLEWPLTRGDAGEPEAGGPALSGREQLLHRHRVRNAACLLLDEPGDLVLIEREIGEADLSELTGGAQTRQGKLADRNGCLPPAAPPEAGCEG